MDSNQVRERIIEVGQLVKKTLIDKQIPAKNKGRGYKYIDDAKSHVRRLFLSFDLLNPTAGSYVFEIGPGNCYFLFMCRELRCCHVTGIDKIYGPINGQGKNAFRLFREHFGLEDVIKHQVVERYKPIDFGGLYDSIVATGATFNRGWGKGEHQFWLRDCYDHLLPGGRLMIHFNTIDAEAQAALPLLRPLHTPDRVKKLTVLSRETIGQLGAGDK
jgi:SAM-dependent methyltransferase